jgi:DNA-binding transcriptional MerR regulator
MTVSLASAPSAAAARDPLQALRAYHGLAPWSLRDLAALSAMLLEASAVVPVNVAARARPSERTVRFYVTRGLVDPPEGRGTAAVYRYRHLLQVLAIKLRQMEGASLEALAGEFKEQTGDMLERRVAAALGPALPMPDELGALERVLPARGRSARALRPRRADQAADAGPRSLLLRRIPVTPGVELAIEAGHPLFRHAGAEETIARHVTAALDQAAADLGGGR